jgi:DNA ligase-associated metallophosphoesterase
MTLLPERAVWWPDAQRLIVADIHLGKDTLFRARGVAMPETITTSDLSRLASLIQKLDARELWVLGDFLHGPESNVPHVIDAIATWRNQLAGRHITLVVGNHDRSAGRLPEHLAIQTVSRLECDGVACVHDPADAAINSQNRPTLPTMAGHLHPGAYVDSGAVRGATLPCFVVEEDLLILPAYGRFTGTARVEPRQGRYRYVLGAGRVVQMDR